MTKRILIELVFEEVEYPDEEWTDLQLREINRVQTDLSPGELSGLGETIAQTDRWQVDHWNELQDAIAGEAGRVKVSSD